MSEEKNIHDNTDSSNSEEEVISTEQPRIRNRSCSRTGTSEPEVEIISSVTEKSGVERGSDRRSNERTKIDNVLCRTSAINITSKTGKTDYKNYNEDPIGP